MKYVKKRFEFSKVVTSILVCSYIYGVVLGTVLVVKILDTAPENAVTAFGALLVFIAPVCAIGINKYYSKSEHENIAKYSGCPPESCDSEETGQNLSESLNADDNNQKG